MSGGIKSLSKNGTNSTIFTLCCGCAICDDQACCPNCKQEIVGHDAETSYDRGRIRWAEATRHWDRRSK